VTFDASSPVQDGILATRYAHAHYFPTIISSVIRVHLPFSVVADVALAAIFWSTLMQSIQVLVVAVEYSQFSLGSVRHHQLGFFLNLVYVFWDRIGEVWVGTTSGVVCSDLRSVHWVRFCVNCLCFIFPSSFCCVSMAIEVH
jgi:hypothetical protein